MSILRKFFATDSSAGILLCLAAILAMIMENSMFNNAYDSLKDTPVVLQIGAFEINKALLLWINDGLMAIFFLMVGLEIKREILEGHLSSPSQFILPAVAAIGGVVAPALIYAYINIGDPDLMDGWAIPAATDIAFALGILLLMGKRIPTSLKVCLVAIAIIDDLIAIIIIALFYTTKMSLLSLGLAGAGLAGLMILNWRGVTKLGPYVIIGLFIWACVLKSGVHATLAGVLIGLIIPLKLKNEDGKSPLKVMEHALHPWVTLGILPLFAFVNAGVSLSGVTLSTFTEPLTFGIMVALFIGKQLGVMVMTFIATRLRICKLPHDITWPQFYGMALLTGVGFTMSLFIGTLAFSNIEYASGVRLGVIAGSTLSAVCGVIVLLLSTKAEPAKQKEAISQ